MIYEIYHETVVTESPCILLSEFRYVNITVTILKLGQD